MFLVLVRFRNAVVGPEQGQDGSSRFRILAHGGHSNFFKQKSHAEFPAGNFADQNLNGINIALLHFEGFAAEGLTDSIAERDRKDSSRATAPLAQAPDALLVDTSDMTIDQVVRFITDNIQQKLSSR